MEKCNIGRNMNLNEHVAMLGLIVMGAGCASVLAADPGIRPTGAVMTPVVRQAGPPPAPLFKAKDFGARGDGVADDTVALRKAITACAGSGGSVVVEGGTFVAGNLELKSNMTLYIAGGATLMASSRAEDFPVIRPDKSSGTAAWAACHRSFLYACGVEKLRIDGGGVIDGNATRLKQAGMRGKEANRPSILRVFSGKDVAVRNVTLQNGLMWTQVYDQCENLVVENLIVRCPPVVANHDGMDICNCRKVVIRNNDLEAEDDVICLKSHGPAGMEDVLIENNTIYCYRANGIKFGTSTVGDIRKIRIINNTIRHAYLGGLCIESVDGANVSGVQVRGLTINDCPQPVFIRLGYRGTYWELDPEIYPKAIGSVGEVSIENVLINAPQAKGIPACTITGLTRKNLGRITLKDIRSVMPGGLSRTIGEPKENDAAYPQSNMFGNTPAHTFFVRHADLVRFENVEAGTAQPDTRPWLYSVDARVETINCRDTGRVVGK